MSLSRVGRTNDYRLGLVQVVDDAVGELEVGLDERGRREREPLVQADILVAVGVEDLKELERRVADVLDVVACVWSVSKGLEECMRRHVPNEAGM